MDEQLEQTEPYEDFHPHDLMKIFDELTFKEKWRKVAWGLKQPPETGAYKWAKLQILRLSAPISAVIVPVIAVLLLMVFAAFAPKHDRSVEVKILEVEEVPELEEIEVLDEEPPEPPEPVEMDLPPTEFAGPPDNTAITPGPEADFSPTPTP